MTEGMSTVGASTSKLVSYTNFSSSQKSVSTPIVDPDDAHTASRLSLHPAKQKDAVTDVFEPRVRGASQATALSSQSATIQSPGDPRFAAMHDAFSSVFDLVDPKTFVALLGTTKSLRQQANRRQIHHQFQNHYAFGDPAPRIDCKERLYALFLQALHTASILKQKPISWALFAREDSSYPLAPLSLTSSPCGRYVVTAFSGHTKATIWDTTSDSIRTRDEIDTSPASVSDAEFCKDGRHVLTRGCDSSVRIWTLTTSPPSAIFLDGQSQFQEGTGFSPDGRFVLKNDASGNIGLWDLQGALPTEIWKYPHHGLCSHMSFSQTGRWLAASSRGVARIFDLHTSIPSDAGSISYDHTIEALGFTQKDSSLVALTSSNTFYAKALCSKNSHENISISSPHPLHIVNISPDGRYAVGGHGPSLMLWALDDTPPMLLGQITAHIHDTHGESREHSIENIGFYMKKNLCISLAKDSVKVWDLKTFPEHHHDLVNKNQQCTSMIQTSALSPDGRFVFISALRQKVGFQNTLWDLEYSPPRGYGLSNAYGLHHFIVTQSRFSFDGQRILIGSFQGIGHLSLAAFGPDARNPPFSGSVSASRSPTRYREDYF